MDDRLDPRFADAVRGALMTEVRASASRRSPHRAPRPPRRRVELVWAGVVAAVAVIAIVIGAVSLAGLAKRAEPAGPGYRQPVQPFDGDCGAVLSEAEVGALSGATVRTTTTDVLGDGSDSLQVPMAGALDCGWAGKADADSDAGLSLVVASADLPGATTRDYDCYSGSSGHGRIWSCAFDAVDGGTWYSGILSTAPKTSERATIAARADLLATLASREAEARSVLPARSEQAWRLLGCERLGADARLAEVLGAPGLTTGQGNGPGPVSNGFVATATWSRQTHCYTEDATASGASPFLDVRALPDGAWLEEGVARRAGGPSQPASGVRTWVQKVSGAAVNGPDSIVVWSFDGPNALRVEATSTTEAQARAASAALLRVLDAKG